MLWIKKERGNSGSKRGMCILLAMESTGKDANIEGPAWARFSKAPATFPGLAKSFFVNLYLKTERCVRLKHLV